MTTLQQKQQISHNFGDAKSLCTCSHTGDGIDSQHLGFNGHGPCAECKCQFFSWASWTPEFQAAIDG